MSPEIHLAPSLLSADFARFGDEARACLDAGARRLHIDVMDGLFVPNLTFGAGIVRALKPWCPEAFFDVHLMTMRSSDLVPAFADAGADAITIHAEADRHLQRTVASIRKAGCQAGIALNPATSPEAVRYVAEDLDLVLVMTVNPGFGGQAFLPAAGRKVAELARLRAVWGASFDIAVDGGVDPQTAPGLVRDGARILVAGTSVFGHPGGIAGGIAALREALS